MLTRRARLLAPTVAVLATATLLLAACGDDDYVGPPAISPTSATLEGPTWVLDVDGLDVQGVSGIVPTIRFLEGQVTGTTGCNSFRGTYVLDGDSLTLSPLASTLIGCPPPLDEVERQILDRLATVTAYGIDGGQLELKDGSDTVLRYEANEPSLEGAWVATDVLYNDAIRSIVGDVELTAEFGADGTVSGSGGCNRFNAGYSVASENVEITTIASTRILCDEEVMDQEFGYFAALESAATWEQVGNELVLFNDEGQRAVSFQKS